MIGFAFGNQEARIDYFNLNPFDLKLFTEVDRSERDLSWITPEIRSIAIKRLKTALADNGEGGAPTPESVEEVLVALDDQETIQSLVAQYRAGNFRSTATLARYGLERVLQYFIPDVYNGSTEPRIDFDNTEPSIMDSAAMRCYGIIMDSHAFPPETRAWAEAMIRVDDSPGWGGPSGFGILKMREWWANNAGAVLAKQYDKATWLPKENPFDWSRSILTPDQSVPPPPAPSPATALTSAPVIPSTPPASEIAPESKTHPRWLWLTLTTATLALGLSAWFVRRKNQ